MEIERIPTENPLVDQWRLLGQFAYPTNIRNYLTENGISSGNAELEEYIAGCVRQAEAYFIATDKASLDISPLLLYYGSSNLLIGIASLLTGEIKDLSHHGMRLDFPKKEPEKKIKSLKEKLLNKRKEKLLADKGKINSESSKKTFRIADFEIFPINPNYGALQYFCNVFSNNCPITSCGSWFVEEIFGSVPDLRKDFENCYERSIPHTIQVEIHKMINEYSNKDRSKKEILYERIPPNEFNRIKNATKLLIEVEGFTKSYLKPQQKHGEKSYITIFRKLHANEIGFYSIYGKKFLELPHKKNGKNLTPSQLIILFMGLFALGSISRYKPQIWNPFIRADVTGERLLVEKFISISQRYIPNLVLNLIRRKRVEFYHPTNSVLIKEEKNEY